MSESLTVIARLRAKVGLAGQLEKELRKLLAPTQAENGCINYELHRSIEDPLLFVFYENWKSQADLDAHFQTPHLTNLRNVLPGIAEGETEITKWKMVK